MPDASVRRFGRNSAALFVSDAGGHLLTAAFRIALAGYLGREVFGEYSFAAVVAVILGVVADVGLANLVTREVSRDPDRPFAVAGPAIAGRVLLTLGLGAGVLLLLSLAGRPAAVLELTATFLLVQVVLGPAVILAAAHRGRERMIRPAAVTLATRAGLVATSFAAMALGAGVQVFPWIAAAWAVPLLLLLRPGLPGAIELRPGEIRGVVARALPIGIGTVLWTIYFRMDVVLLGLLRGDAEAGLFAAPFSVVEAVLLLQGPLIAAAFPVLASRGAADRGRRDTFRALTSALYAVGLPLAALLVVEPGPVLAVLFGESFSDGQTTLRLLALTIPVSFLAAPRLSLLIARDRERIYAAIMGAGVFVNVGLALLLIPAHGATGAAVATLATEVLVMLLAFFAWRETDDRGRILRGLAAGLILGGILAAAGSLGVSALARIAGALVLYAAWVATRWFRRRSD